MKMHGGSRNFCYLAIPILLLVASVVLSTPALAQMTSTGLDCSQIGPMQLLKQDNMRAGQTLVECGVVPGGQPANGKKDETPEAAAPNIRVSNRSCTNAQNCTKSENMVWGSPDGQTIVVNYNDHNGSSYSGTSYSQDGGTTFTEISPAPFASGHGSNYGDPIVVFNAKLSKWFAGDLVTSCGGFGIGLWTSTDGKTWTAGACAHNGTSDDRESMWVDNEPTSGTYGRMYISWGDYAAGGDTSVVYSDNGTTWSSPVRLNNGSPFIRNVQITGSPVGATRYEGANSTVFVAGMDEGSGGCSTRQNLMYKSLDGGVTWTHTTLGPRFNAICDALCSGNSYFAQVNPIIRHMGWGEPAVGPNGVVHYVYAGKGASKNDPGDIYYVRSTDNGATWSTPVKFNLSKENQFKTQWMPSLSADASGRVTASWYDRKKSTSKCNVATDKACSYKRIARQSSDNGVTFGAEIAVSPLINQPQQQDPGVVGCYAGDYDYDTAINGNALITWTDGRRNVGGIHVQDVDFAALPLP